MTQERKREIVEELVGDRLSRQGWISSPAKYAGNIRMSYENWCAFELAFDEKGCRMLSWAPFILKDEQGFMERKRYKEPHSTRLRSGSVNDLASQVEKAAGLLKYAVTQRGTVECKRSVDWSKVEE